MAMDEFKYDQDEMKMRNLVYEFAKLDVLASSFLMALEWRALKEKYNFEDSEYPNLARQVHASESILDVDSASYKTLFENPLTKLAVISQVPPKSEDEKTDTEKSPG